MIRPSTDQSFFLKIAKRLWRSMKKEGIVGNYTAYLLVAHKRFVIIEPDFAFHKFLNISTLNTYQWRERGCAVVMEERDVTVKRAEQEKWDSQSQSPAFGQQNSLFKECGTTELINDGVFHLHLLTTCYSEFLVLLWLTRNRIKVCHLGKCGKTI